MSFECPLLVLATLRNCRPIQGGGFFTDWRARRDADRVQSPGAGRSIVRMSMDVREGANFDIGRYGKRGGLAHTNSIRTG